MRRPHGNTYWLLPGRLLAGEHPVASWGMNARARVGSYLDCGVLEFVDLTEPGELGSYREVLATLSAERGLDTRYRRFPIADMDVPRERRRMDAILDHLDAVAAAGRAAYVHCWGGIGRTGTVMGCFLVRHGLSGDEALAHLAGIWPIMDKSRAFPVTPQTWEQHAYVRDWLSPD